MILKSSFPYITHIMKDSKLELIGDQHSFLATTRINDSIITIDTMTMLTEIHIV